MKIKYLIKLFSKNNVKLFLSLFVYLLFVIYNLYFGINYKMKWNVAIGFYYIILFMIKLLILLFIKKELKYKTELTIYIITFIFIIFLNISLIWPIILMLSNQRNGNIGTIPSLSIATYAFYSLTISIINLIRQKNINKLLLKQYFLINHVNALVSILTLQNTLILTNGEYTYNLKILTLISSILIYILIIVLTLLSFIKNIKMISKNKC